MNTTEMTIARKHVQWALLKISPTLTASLAQEEDAHELIELERILRAALRGLAQLEDVE